MRRFRQPQQHDPYQPTPKRRPQQSRLWRRLFSGLLLIWLFLGGMLGALAQITPTNSVNLQNTAGYTYKDPAGRNYGGQTNNLNFRYSPLVDPAGRILNCAGQPFNSYAGFKISLYEALNPMGDLGNLVALTATSLLGSPGVAKGVAPNITNTNPFDLDGSGTGAFNFLLDPAKGQLTEGRIYVLLISSPNNLGLAQRRIRITIGATNALNQVAFEARALDGRPLTVTGGNFFEQGTLTISYAARLGLALADVNIGVDVCEQTEIQIVKTADRAAAEPGDVVAYRVEVRNFTNSQLDKLVITDALPLGVNIIPNSVRGSIGSNSVPVTLTQSGNSLTLSVNGTVPAQAQNVRLQVVYAATVTPDVIRGDGRNSALVSARRLDNNQTVRDGPAVFTLKSSPGITTDCATIIGRVFEDRNFDGEQQPNEPGIPNAVIFMDDGNRIVTDANGLYSVINVLPGSRSLVLDFSSLPGYTLAPNLYFIERNSQSRLVRLEPGGLYRANFAVTPIFRGTNPRGGKS
ncbi:MAG: isopeptide-forming domain-containing fimbrial protein [Pseudanabaena sp. ELA607]